MDYGEGMVNWWSEISKPVRNLAAEPVNTLAPIRIPRDTCVNFELSSRLEWLETDGTGSFAMGTAAGVNTRRYHGLLVAALRPPINRHVLLSKAEETVSIHGRDVEISTTQYPGAVAPSGYQHLAEFYLDPFPSWSFDLGDVRVRKQLFLVYEKRTVVVRYFADAPCLLRVCPFVAYRDFHSLSRANSSLNGRVANLRTGRGTSLLEAYPYPGFPRLLIQHNGLVRDDKHGWYYQTEYLEEASRGLDSVEDLYCLGTLLFEIGPHQNAWWVASLDEDAWDSSRVEEVEHRERVRRASREPDPRLARLSAAADAFVAVRADGTPTVIAGYPWFSDWGRDTMISLPGLFLARDAHRQAQAVLAGFLEKLSQGIIPNRFPDGSEAAEYNTVDATLWMFYAVFEYLRTGGDQEFVRNVFYPKAKDIIAWHERGTHHGIHVDANDGLLVAGNAGTQLTWMDAKVGDWVVTPRHGKPVEINALYYNALRFMETLATDIGDPLAEHYAKAARTVSSSFLKKFWDPNRQCLYDVVNEQGPDARIRPNQIFAVSLPHSMLSMSEMQAVVRRVQTSLLTPYGLRTLAREDRDYHPHYRGGPLERDGAYHQGTVWPWLLGPFITAYLRAFGRDSQTLTYCETLVDALLKNFSQGCLGQLSEVFDGDSPFTHGGAPAQAWSVAELYRVLKELGTSSSPHRT